MKQIRRRQFLRAVGVGSLSLSLPALAQQEKRVRRIGYFILRSLQANAPNLAAFRKGMAELGWVENREYVMDERYANGVPEAAPALVAELLALQPDLLLTAGDVPARLFALRTKTIPIVFAAGQDPVGNGIVASLQRPGGNATGLTSLARELGAKRLQLLKEAFPRVTHVAVLFQADVGGLSQVNEIEEAALRLKIRVTRIELRQAADVEAAFKRGAALGAQGYMMTQSGLINVRRQAILDRALHSRLPIIFGESESVEAGGLMSYAASFEDNFRRAAAYVDKILKGAKPGDLPVEQPIKFELGVNLKTAKAIGLTFPQAILLRADRVIE